MIISLTKKGEFKHLAFTRGCIRKANWPHYVPGHSSNSADLEVRHQENARVPMHTQTHDNND